MNWVDFFDMGGYAFYVWGSYGLAFAAIVIEVAALFLRRRTLLKRLSLLRQPTAIDARETPS